MAKRNRQPKGSSQHGLSQEPLTSLSPPLSKPNGGITGQFEVMHVTQEEFAGPLPDPRTLAEYNRISPGLADSIVNMAKQEQAHRHAMDRKSLNGFITSRIFGQVAAFLLGSLGIGGGIYLVAIGKSVVGLSAFLTSLASLLCVFLISRKSPKKPSTDDPSEDEDSSAREA